MRLVTTLLLLTILALPAGAVSKRKLCVQGCGSLIGACATRNQDLGDFGRACKTAVLRACRKGGPAVCATTTTTTTSSTTTTTLRFVDNGDGTVTDNQTGLQWEKKQNLDNIPNLTDPHDADNKYSWNTTVGETAPNGTAFTSFLASLNDCRSSDGAMLTGGFAGHCDWRLPSIVELAGITDLSAPGCGTFMGPCIDQTVFGPTVANNYWSATTYATFPFGAWNVFFSNGLLCTDDKNVDDYVRAVRSGS